MIIGLSGFIGSGKTTVANTLLREYGFYSVSFADALKDAVSTIFGWERNLLEGDTQQSREFRENVDVWWSNRLGYNVTPRQVLQTFGTEACRNGFHRDIWIHALAKRIENLSHVVIPDVRFPNELLFLHQNKGTAVKLIRGKQPSREELLTLHESERAIAAYNFNYVIENNGTIDDLNVKVVQLLTDIHFFDTVKVESPIFYHPV